MELTHPSFFDLEVNKLIIDKTQFLKFNSNFISFLFIYINMADVHLKMLFWNLTVQ